MPNVETAGLNLGQGAPNYVGGGQNYGPFVGTLSIRCRIIIGIQKGTIILTTTHETPCPLHLMISMH